jgi:uncharacterized protein YkwD
MQRRTFLHTGSALVAASVLPRAARAEGSEALLRALRALRHDMGLALLFPDPALTEMSRRQALHMHRIGRPVHTGPDGSDPIVRGVRSGYGGRILGEVLAESVESPVGTLELWLSHDRTRAVLLDPEARDVGLSGIGNRRAGFVHWNLVLGA